MKTLLLSLLLSLSLNVNSLVPSGDITYGTFDVVFAPGLIIYVCDGEFIDCSANEGDIRIILIEE